MAEESRDDTGKRLEAACNDLIDIEDISPNSSLDNHQKASQRNTDKPISSILHFAERSTTKDTSEDKYIDQANLNKASQYSREMDKEETSESTTLTRNGHEENRQEKKLSENKVSAKCSETEKEEGNYEELVCLVRQFYVERPINPAAIAYQNIETC